MQQCFWSFRSHIWAFLWFWLQLWWTTAWVLSLIFHWQPHNSNSCLHSFGFLLWCLPDVQGFPSAAFMQRCCGVIRKMHQPSTYPSGDHSSGGPCWIKPLLSIAAAPVIQAPEGLAESSPFCLQQQPQWCTLRLDPTSLPRSYCFSFLLPGTTSQRSYLYSHVFVLTSTFVETQTKTCPDVFMEHENMQLLAG